MRPQLRIVAALFAGLMGAACGGATLDVPYAAPATTGDGLATGEPERWVAECTRAQAPEFSGPYVRGYGFQWWLDRFSPPGRSTVTGFGGRGRGGQFVFVVPESELVVVFTGWNDDDLERQAYDMMERYVLSAIDPRPRQPAR